MREVVLFCEDFAHQQVLEALVRCLAQKHAIGLQIQHRSVRGGHGAVIREYKQFIRDIYRERESPPDLIIVARDANCGDYQTRRKELLSIAEKIPMLTIIPAVPDPHIERWLLLDSRAFKAVFGRGCAAPDYKCERYRYKSILIDEIRKAGVMADLGGIEFAEDLVREMNFDWVAKADRSFADCVGDVETKMREWQA